jgi:hypothetical protein
LPFNSTESLDRRLIFSRSNSIGERELPWPGNKAWSGFFINGVRSMDDRVSYSRRKADECEQMAKSATDPDLRASCVHLALRWREMADRAEAMARVIVELKPRGAAVDSR